MKIISIFLIFAIILGVVVALPGGDHPPRPSAGPEGSMGDYYEYDYECEYYEYSEDGSASASSS